MAPTIIALFVLTAAILTINGNQANAASSYQHILFRFHSVGPIVCSNSMEVELNEGYVDFTKGASIYVDPSGTENLRDRDFHALSLWGRPAGDLVTQPGSLGLRAELSDWQFTGIPPNQDFMINGKITRDNLCGTEVGKDITIRGSCQLGSIGRIESPNGLRMEFVTDGRITEMPSLYPVCMVCPEDQTAYFISETLLAICTDEGMAVNAMPNSNETGANPSEIDSSTGRVEIDDKPPEEDGQEIQSSDEQQIPQTDDNEKTDMIK